MHNSGREWSWFFLQLLGGLVLLGVAFFAVNALQVKSTIIRETVIRHHHSSFVEMENFLRFVRGGAESVERDLILLEMGKDTRSAGTIHDKLRTIVELHEWVDQIVVVRPDGAVVAASDQVISKNLVFSHMDLVALHMRGPGVHVTEPFTSQFGVVYGQTVILVGRHLTDLSGKIIGTLLAAVSPDAFFAGMTSDMMAGQGVLRLLHDDNTEIARTGDAEGQEEVVYAVSEIDPHVVMIGYAAPVRFRFWDNGPDTGVATLAGGALALVLVVLGEYLRGERAKAQRRRLIELEEAVAARTRELSEAVERLKASEADLVRAQSVAHMGSWTLDLRSNVLVWSDEIYKIFDLNPQEFGASYDAFLEAIHPEDREAVNRAYTNSLKTCEPYTIRHRLLRTNGEVRWVDERCIHELDETGKVIRSDGTVQDITERKLVEDQLAESKERLARSNEELQQFAYVVSHDLQEPLRMVSSYLQLLERRCGNALDQEGREFIAYAVDGAQRMSGMIKDLLELSRVETKGGELVAVETGPVLQAALGTLTVTVEEAGAQIDIPSKPPLVLGDAGQLERLFQNLIGNALKYRKPDQPPKISVTAEKAGRFVKFTVADNGIGIEPKYFDRIFVIFQRLHRREEFDGSGMGLAICKKIVARHGGDMGVTSTPGEGSRFWFTLPKAL